MKYIFYILLGYLLYRFITGFLIPAFRTGRQIKKQFGDMQQRMQEQMEQQQAAYNKAQRPPTQNTTVKSTTTSGDYIDFEEVK